MDSPIKPRLLLVDSLVALEGAGVKTFGQLLASQLMSIGYHLIATSYFRNKILRIIDIAVTLLTNRKSIDIILLQVYSGQNFFITDLTSWLGGLFKIPTIFHFHGGNIPAFLSTHPSWSSRVLNRVMYSVTPSEFLQMSLEQYGIKAIRIPNCINVESYPFIQRIKIDPILVWLRSFHHIYNPELALRTMELLQKDFPDTFLAMAGMDKCDGSLQKTQALSLTLGLNDRVEIASQIKKSDVASFLNKGNIYINTTNIDNTPISVLEAMACGLCIVSTNVGGIPYLLEDGVNALLVPPNDPVAMTTAIKRILTEPGLVEKLSTNARKKAEQFDWSSVLPMWENLFQDVLEHE